MEEPSLSRARELIETNAADWAPEVAKAAIQLVPVVGPLAAFALDQRPQTQIKRVVTYLGMLGDLLSDVQLDIQQLQARWEETPEGSNLFDRGMTAASQATSEARLLRLAAIVADGLQGEEVHAMNAARRLRTLQELDDGEFALLVVVERERRLALSYGPTFNWKSSWRAETLTTEGSSPVPPLPPELVDWTMGDLSLGLNRLAGLGLIEAGEADKEHEGEGPARSFAATPAGHDLIRLCRVTRTGAEAT